jgi:hypothetical protein
MPFREAYQPVLAVVKDAAHLLGMKVVQIGEEPFAGSIISHIRGQIEAADIMLAIVSEENGNVYYEIGLAHCQAKPVVLLTNDAKTLKFDLRDHRAIVYDPGEPSAIRDDLVRTFKAVLDSQANPEGYLASTFAGTAHEPHRAYEKGLQKAVGTIASEASLCEPVQVKQVHLREKSRDLAIEVEDFMGTRVRAIVDINGLIRVMKSM